MIETSNPAIDVNELMERVRREAAKVMLPQNGLGRTRTTSRSAMLPAIREIPAPPVLGLSRPVESKKERLDAMLRKARGMIEVSSWIPKMFRGFFRRQGGFNRTVLDTITALAKTNEQLNKRVRELSEAASAQNQWLRVLSGQRQSDAVWMRAAQERISQTTDGQSQLTELFGKLQAELERQQGQNQQLERHGEHLRDLQGQADRAGEHLRNLQIESDRHENRTQELRQSAERLRDLQSQADRAGEHLRNLEASSEGRLQDLRNLREMLVLLEKRQINDAVYIKGELSQQSAFVQRWLDSGRPGPTGVAAEQVGRAAEWDAHRLDSFYLSFENRFRGDRAEIKERVRFYLPVLSEADAGAPGRPIIDLGCGRGEWLELLQENRLEAMGVDLNKAMVGECAERNLPVTEGDAVAYMRSLPDDSQGAVTGFHIIEHLPLETLVDLFSEARRVLRPGGLVIFESPNCKNLMVGACNFNVDPTHKNPVFPETAEFMLGTQGFESIEIKYLSPVDVTLRPEAKDLAPVLFDLFYGPQDFAVIGRKPGPR